MPCFVNFELADLDDPRIGDLLATHARLALGAARCRVGHALDLDGLRHPDIQVFSIAVDGRPVAVGALRRLDALAGELKSMFVDDSMRGQGLGSKLLAQLIETARGAGLTRLYLETGAADYFAAARALYSRHGFIPCEAFADLSPHPDSCFMSRRI